MTIAGVSEGTIRFTVFLVLLIAFAAFEWWRPRRSLTIGRGRRWPTNLGIAGISTLLMRGLGSLAVPIAAVATAVACERAGIGLFNLLALPVWLEVIAAMIVLDLAIWFQHWASHHVPVLWRLHAMHHADRDFDVTTAVRFHPVEIALSMVYKMLLVVLLGPAALAVVLFEMVLNGCSLFNHANIALPGPVDRVLRWLLVTPDMHRIHHSVIRREHDTNFGFNLSWWDRLFGTYTESPEAGQLGMTIGLAEHQDAAPARLGWSLASPFRRTNRETTRPAPDQSNLPNQNNLNGK